MSKRRLVKVRFREVGAGRDGGLGDIKSYITNAKNVNKKLRKNAVIVSIREVKQ